MSDEKVNLIFSAVDKLSADVTAIDHKLSTLEQTTKKTSTALDALRGHLGAVGSVMQGAAIGFGIRVFDALADAIHRVTDAIPDLIERGASWGTTVLHMSQLTGLAADKSSILAGVATLLGNNVDDLGTSFARLGKSLIDNPALLKKWGINVQSASSQSDFAWQVISKLREKVAALGPSFLTTGAAATAFGRGAKSIIEFLTASPAEFARLSADVQAAGGVLTAQGLAAARAWEIAQARINFQITSIGSMIFQGVAPALTGLLDAVTGAIRANMDKIVNFVVQVVGFIAGVISGLLGVDLSLDSFSTNVADTSTSVGDLGNALDQFGKQAKSATPKSDALTTSLNSQIKAIDRQIEALDRLAKRRDEQRERDRLIADINTARAQLDDLKTKGLFLAGMTETEKELARQKQAADIIDAEKALSDAKQALADHDRQVALDQQRQMLEDQRKHLEDMLSAHQKALSAITGQNQNFLKKFLGGLPKIGADTGKGIGASVGTAMSGAIKSAMADALAAGKEFAQQIKTFLFGTTTTTYGGPVSPGGFPTQTTVTQQGGFIDTVAKWVKSIGDFVGAVNQWLNFHPLGDNLPSLGEIVGGLFALNFVKGLIPWVATLGTGIASGFLSLASTIGTTIATAITTGISSLLGAGGSLLGGAGGALGGLVLPKSILDWLNSLAGGNQPAPGYVGSTPTAPTGAGGTGLFGAVFTPAMAAQLLLNTDTTAQNTGPYGSIARNLYDMASTAQYGADASQNTADQVANGVTVQGDSLSLIGAHTLSTATNTQPMADGSVGVTSGYFGNLPYLTNISGHTSATATNTNPLADGSLGVNNSQFSYLGSYLPGIHSRTGSTVSALTSSYTTADYLSRIWQNLVSVNGYLVSDAAGVSRWTERIERGFHALYPYQFYAQGGAGMTPAGGMSAVLGEAGTEAYAILRNPRPLGGGGFAAGGSDGGGSAVETRVEQPVKVYLNEREVGEFAIKYAVRHGTANNTSWVGH